MFMQTDGDVGKRRRFTRKTWRLFVKTRRLLPINRHVLQNVYSFIETKMPSKIFGRFTFFIYLCSIIVHLSNYHGNNQNA